MKCQQIQNRLLFFIEGSLSEKETADVSSHIQSCSECKSIYIELKATLGVIETEKKPEVNPFLFTRIQQQIENKQSIEKRKVNIARILQPFVIAVFLLFGILAGFLMGTEFYYPQDDSISESNNNEAYYINDFQQERIETFLLSDYDNDF